MNEPCVWTEPDERGNHDVCREAAVFSVPVEYESGDGMKSDRLSLCTTHALMASREGIAKP